MRNLACLVLLLALPGCDRKTPKPPVPEATTPTSDTLPYYTEKTFTARWLSREEADKEKPHTISDFAYTNQDGKEITKDFLDGQIAVVNWFFTVCQGICPKIMGNVHETYDAFPQDSGIVFLSHSVTPKLDTPAVLRKYADKREIKTLRWQLVTGDREKIYAHARTNYFADQEAGVREKNGIMHTENVILLDPEGHIRGVYNGTLRMDMKRLIADIRVLKKELEATD